MKKKEAGRPGFLTCPGWQLAWTIASAFAALMILIVSLF